MWEAYVAVAASPEVRALTVSIVYPLLVLWSTSARFRFFVMRRHGSPGFSYSWRVRSAVGWYGWQGTRGPGRCALRGGCRWHRSVRSGEPSAVYP